VLAARYAQVDVNVDEARDSYDCQAGDLSARAL
jgi:hypothetical protein